MKKLFLLLLVVIICSCNSDNPTDSLPQEKPSKLAANPYAINKENAMGKAMSFINSTNNGLRSSKGTNIENISIETDNYAVTIAELSDNEEIKQEIPVYTINYKNESGEEDGFVVLAGDERIAADVLIFCNEENAVFDWEKMDDTGFLKDLIAGYLFNSINGKIEENKIEEISNTTAITTRKGVERHVLNYGNAIAYMLNPQIALGQNQDPYNRYAPLSNGSKCLAGSAAAAMGSIMLYYEWPLKGAYKNLLTNAAVYPTYFSNLTAYEKSLFGARNLGYCEAFYPKVTLCMAHLMAEIGYKMNSSYGLNITTANPNNIPLVFNKMGYDTDGITDYSFAAVQRDIEQRASPVLMFGYEQNVTTTNRAHCYVITQTYYNVLHGLDFISLMHGDDYSGIYTDPNGRKNWNFSKDMFSSSSSNSYVPSSDEVVYPYRYRCKIITNIRPNTTNSGSTDPTWRAY